MTRCIHGLFPVTDSGLDAAIQSADTYIDAVCRSGRPSPTRGEGEKIVEGLAEVQLVTPPLDIADMGRAQHVGHAEEGMAAVVDRLGLVHVEGGESGPAFMQGVEQGAGGPPIRPGWC